MNSLTAYVLGKILSISFLIQSQVRKFLKKASKMAEVRHQKAGEIYIVKTHPALNFIENNCEKDLARF